VPLVPETKRVRKIILLIHIFPIDPIDRICYQMFSLPAPRLKAKAFPARFCFRHPQPTTGLPARARPPRAMEDIRHGKT
jgi:hypothetical protein